MILINAENKVLGRLATYAAKKALAGEQVTIVNAEKALITGTRKTAMQKIKTRRGLKGKGNPEKGPKYSRMPDKILRQAIRGMLPWKSSRGKQAFRKIHAYNGIPESLQGQKFTEMPKQNTPKTAVTIEEISRLLGAKW